MTIEEIASKHGLSHRITTILEYHYDQIMRDIRAELPNNESEDLEMLIEDAIGGEIDNLKDLFN